MKRSSFLWLFAVSATCAGLAVRGESSIFRRGDANQDDALDLSDATHTLGFLFLGRPGSLGCDDAADANDDGTVDVADPIHSLGFLFLGSRPPPAPFDQCGPDPSRDALGCAASAGCEPRLPGEEARFGGPVSYAVGHFPTCVALGDLSGDGALDLAVTCYNSFDVQILLGAGNGSFAEAVSYPLVPRARSTFVALGDLDGNSALDLVVANWDHDDLSVLLGAGDGTFEEAVTYPACYGPYALALGDLDGDGALDVAVAGSEGNVAAILRGAGDGTVGDTARYPVGQFPVAVALGDLDRDGALDLAVANKASDDVSVLLGSGDGALRDAVSYSVADLSHAIALGDFDGDGALDAAVASWGRGGVSILLGQGDGSFGDAAHCSAGRSPYSIALGDVDRDGVLDLVVADATSEDVSILLGLADGSFAPADLNPTGPGSSQFAALGDVNADHALDVAVAKHTSSPEVINAVSVLLGR